MLDWESQEGSDRVVWCAVSVAERMSEDLKNNVFYPLTVRNDSKLTERSERDLGQRGGDVVEDSEVAGSDWTGVAKAKRSPTEEQT